MKEFVKKTRSLLTFDHPTQMGFINQEFQSTHTRYRQQYAAWSINATCKKLVAQYWFSYVLGHFALMIGLGFISVCLFQGPSISLSLVTIVVSIIAFPILLICNYWPGFYSQFLPALETVHEMYQQAELEKLDKCRQLQLSNLSLALVYYVLDKTSGILALESTDRFSLSLTNLFGVDNGSLKKNITLILGAPATLRALTDRKRTEIRNKFTEAYEFLEALPFPAGITILRELEMKCRL